MRAAVIENDNLALVCAHHDHGLAADLQGVVVADVLHLRLVPAVHPDLLKYVFDLVIENCLIRVDLAMHAIRFHQALRQLHGALLYKMIATSIEPIPPQALLTDSAAAPYMT